MPTGRTTVAYTPTLTPEEEAALAAEQAAAAPAPEQTVMYQPSSPPPAEPVAAPAAPVEQTTMYQPSSPPPAAEPAAEPYTSISPQVTDTSNPAVEPGMSAPPSERRDSYTVVNQAYQPAEPYTSISPQDAGNASRSAYPVSVSDFRDPLKTPEAQAAQETRYQPSDPGRQNVPTFGDNFVTSLGTSLGLDPKDPNEDMANQITRRLYDWMGTTATATGKNVLQKAGQEVPRAINQIYLDPLRTLASPLTGAGNLSGPIANLARAEWGLVEDIAGPHGNLLRQIQSTANPVGNAISRLGDAIGADPQTDELAALVQEGKRNWDAFNDRTGRVTSGEEDAGRAMTDLLNFPLPSFGGSEPQPRDIDLTKPDWTWLLTPGAVAREAGFDLGAAARAATDDTDVRGMAESGRQKAQQAKGAAIGARLRGGSSLDAAMAAAQTLLPADLPSMPLRSLRELAPASSSPAPAVPGKVSSYTPRDPAAPEPIVIPARSNEIFTNDIRWPWQRDDATEPAAGQTGSVRTSSTVTDPTVIERAREAANAAKAWASGLDMPQLDLPDLNLPFRRGTSTPSPIDPNALYMPLPPPPSLADRARDAIDYLTPELIMPDEPIGSATLPAQPGEPIRTATLPPGAVAGQARGQTWVKDANGMVIGMGDPATGDYVLFPENATKDDKARIIQGIYAQKAVGNGGSPQAYDPREPTVEDGAPLSVRRSPFPPTVEDGAPLVVRRTGPEGVDPNAMIMPPGQSPSLMDRARAAGGNLMETARDILPGGDTAPPAPAPEPAIDPNALYMPEAPPPSLTDRLRTAGNDAVQGIADRLPNVDLPDISLPGRGTPRGGPGTGGRSAGAPPATDPLQQVFTEQQSGATRTATQPEGTSLAQEAGADWIKDANGNYVGLVDPNTGEYVMLPANATNEEKQAIVNGILSATPSNPAPGPATATQPTTATGTTTGSSTGTATGSSNAGSTTGGTRSNGTSGGSGFSGTSTGRKSRSSDTSYDDDGEDTPLKLEDFIQDFDGDGVISKRDRMQGKKAFEQAKMARSKQRRGKTTRKNSAKNFPFNDRRSALGQQIARDVADALAGKG